MKDKIDHIETLIALRGFTLIEMLVVIAIIGVLASVVIGVLDTARNNAVDVTAINTSKNILPIVLECVFAGDAVTHLNDSNTGGGSICSAGRGATIPWPKLPPGWVWISGFPGHAPPDSIYVVKKTFDNSTYYIGCGYSGCKLNGPNPTPPP